MPDSAPSSVTANPATTNPSHTSAGHHIVDVSKAGGLEKVTSFGTNAPVDPGELLSGMALVAGNYRDPAGGTPVLFIGVDHVPEDTSKRREHLFRGMLEHVQWDPELGQPESQPVDPGPLGGSVECLLASLAEEGNVLCGWADEKTAGVALFENMTVEAASRTFAAMRRDIER
ncbi:hypothetical protein [Streptomyces sp. NPDC051909]|uniref:hypothetical protein n=1 Tax=Streptomyces sp. NPDC051909 TaxID=3154944 RepID=UPI003423EE8C